VERELERSKGQSRGWRLPNVPSANRHAYSRCPSRRRARPRVWSIGKADGRRFGSGPQAEGGCGPVSTNEQARAVLRKSEFAQTGQVLPENADCQIAPLAETVPPHWLTEEVLQRGHEATLFASADSHRNASACAGNTARYGWAGRSRIRKRPMPRDLPTLMNENARGSLT
jgi:hypothetical protein